MKSGCFGQNFVFSGSDNFAVYGWKIPEFLDQHGNETRYIRRAQLVLHGHRSIVNQVRFNSTYSILGTSGKFFSELREKFICCHYFMRGKNMQIRITSSVPVDSRLL